MKSLLTLIIIFISLPNYSNAKDLILGCKFTEWITIENNYQTIEGRNDIVNPTILDGYIHYNFDKKFLRSDLSHLGRYGTIYSGTNKSKEITLSVSNGSDVITFFVTYGPSSLESLLESKSEQNSFSINKYNNRMTVEAYKVGKPNGDRIIVNYNCKNIPKPSY